MTLWSPNISDIRVYIGFAAPFAEPATWNEISSYVNDVNINRGRANEFSRFGPGTATITLNNHDRRFDPTFSSGPYYSGDPTTGLGLNNHIKIEVVHGPSGGTQTATNIFRGYVSSWPQRYESAGKHLFTTIQCFDLLGMVGRTKSAKSALVQYMTNAASLYCPFQEQQVAMGEYWHEVSSPSSRTDGWYADDAAFNVTLDTPSGAGTFWGNAATMIGYNPTDNPNGFRPTSAADLNFWMVGDTLSDSIEIHIAGTLDNGYITIAPNGVADDGAIKFHMYNYATGYATANYPTAGSETLLVNVDSLFDGTPKHIYFDRSSAPNISVYTNGIFRGTVSYSTAYSGSIAVLNTYMYIGLGSYISHVAIGGDPGRAYSIGTGSELTNAKPMIEEAMTYANVDPATWLSADTGTQVMVGTNPEGAFLVNYLNDVASSEQGALFCNAQGKITFSNRDKVVSPSIKFFVGPSGEVTSFREISSVFSDQVVLRNDVTATWSGGSVEAQDNDSIEKYGTYSSSLSAPFLAYEGDAIVTANRHIERYGSPQDSVNQLTVMLGDPNNDATAVSRLVQSELGQGVVVIYDPVGSGENVWRALRIEGIAWRFTPSVATVTITTSSISNVNGPLWILNHPTYGRVSSNNLLG